MLPLFRAGRCRDDVRRDLFAAVAELNQLAGWMAYDVGDVGNTEIPGSTTSDWSRDARGQCPLARRFRGFSCAARVPDLRGGPAPVDRLSDDGFPVEHVRIVGTGLHSVEQVTGRLTKGRAALGGAAAGCGSACSLGCC